MKNTISQHIFVSRINFWKHVGYAMQSNFQVRKDLLEQIWLFISLPFSWR